MNSEKAPIQIGILRLTDAAPLVVAREKGFFAAHGLDVRLCVEPSWANIADKLTFGRMDAALMLPPLALAMAAGLRGPATPVIVPMGLSLNGNSVTVSHDIAATMQAGGETDAAGLGERLARWVRGRRTRPRFAVVHVFSTHNLLLRHWLAAAGLAPGDDIEIVVLPPADTAQALLAGEIDGFCAGAPWGPVAVASGAGRMMVKSSDIWPGHPEKCLAVGSLAERSPHLLRPLLAALSEAAAFCGRPGNAAEIAGLLARREYLDVDAGLIRASLPHDEPAAFGAADRSVFAGHDVNVPSRDHALWFLAQLRRWGYLPGDIDPAALAGAVYRPDLCRVE